MTKVDEKEFKRFMQETIMALKEKRTYTVNGSDEIRYAAPSKFKKDAAWLIKYLNTQLTEEIQAREAALKKADHLANFLHQAALGLRKLIDSNADAAGLTKMAKDILQQIPKTSRDFLSEPPKEIL